jgi:uncharacterized protein (UPF0335 family)
LGDDEIEQLALLASLRREVTASRALLAAAEDAVLLLATVSGTGEEGDEDGDGDDLRPDTELAVLRAELAIELAKEKMKSRELEIALAQYEEERAKKDTEEKTDVEQFEAEVETLLLEGIDWGKEEKRKSELQVAKAEISSFAHTIANVSIGDEKLRVALERVAELETERVELIATVEGQETLPNFRKRTQKAAEVAAQQLANATARMRSMEAELAVLREQKKSDHEKGTELLRTFVARLARLSGHDTRLRVALDRVSALEQERAELLNQFNEQQAKLEQTRRFLRGYTSQESNA